MQSPIIRGVNNSSISKSKSAIQFNQEEEKKEEEDEYISDDFSDAISKLIDDEDEVSVDLS